MAIVTHIHAVMKILNSLQLESKAALDVLAQADKVHPADVEEPKMMMDLMTTIILAQSAMTTLPQKDAGFATRNRVLNVLGIRLAKVAAAATNTPVQLAQDSHQLKDAERASSGLVHPVTTNLRWEGARSVDAYAIQLQCVAPVQEDLHRQDAPLVVRVTRLVTRHHHRQQQEQKRHSPARFVKMSCLNHTVELSASK